jgi:hypothetical protein
MCTLFASRACAPTRVAFVVAGRWAPSVNGWPCVSARTVPPCGTLAHIAPSSPVSPSLSPRRRPLAMAGPGSIKPPPLSFPRVLPPLLTTPRHRPCLDRCCRPPTIDVRAARAPRHQARRRHPSWAHYSLPSPPFFLPSTQLCCSVTPPLWPQLAPPGEGPLTIEHGRQCALLGLKMTLTVVAHPAASLPPPRSFPSRDNWPVDPRSRASVPRATSGLSPRSVSLIGGPRLSARIRARAPGR